MKNKTLLFLSGMILFLTSISTLVNANLVTTTLFENTPPNPPEIEGPTYGLIKTVYTYNITITDPDVDDELLLLEVDFGDGIISEDCGCGRIWQNGEIIYMSHQWKREGSYQITARVQDVHGAWSEWSEPIPVTMPKNKVFLFSIFEKILSFLPNIYNLF